MGRFPQKADGRGSLKWIQRAANDAVRPLDAPILALLPKSKKVSWLSPIASDGYAEYRDAAFLEKLGLSHLTGALAEYWPARGPQWDALATTDAGDALLVEAKAHVAELCSPGSSAGEASLARIRAALRETAAFIGANPLAEWHSVFYQLANRLAHLHFLRKHGVNARLVLVNFVGDAEMNGPRTEEAWRAAYEVVWHIMGVPRRHRLRPHVLDVCLDVATMKDGG